MCAPRSFEFRGLVIAVHPEVYEPEEDTFLLLDALEFDDASTVLELGTGTGLIALDCARRGATVVATDLNPFAVACARANRDRNLARLAGEVQVRIGDLFAPVAADERFDVVAFNPPYLPTAPEDLVGGSGWFDRAISGGPDGLEPTHRFITGLPDHLNACGAGYFVASSLAESARLGPALAAAGLDSVPVAERAFNFERLTVYKLTLRAR